VANYYKEINKIMEKIIHKALILDKKGFKIGKKNQDLSLLDMLIIKKIGKESKKSIYNLVKETEVDRGVIATIINKLVATGYIIKEKAEEDKRVNMVSLTQEGEAVYNMLVDSQKEFFDVILNDITLNEEKTILKFLSKINQNIK
jgi:DNA-binding MarR family transcriptional regulator